MRRTDLWSFVADTSAVVCFFTATSGLNDASSGQGRKPMSLGN